MLTSVPRLFSADVLKKCALLALHVIAQEGRDGDGCHVPGLGDEWKMELHQCAQCGRVKAKLGRTTNVCPLEALVKAVWVQRCVARHRVVWAWGQDLSFLAGLGAGKGGIELSHGPGHAMPGNEWALVAGLPLLKGPLSQQDKPFSHRGRAVTKTKRVVVRE